MKLTYLCLGVFSSLIFAAPQALAEPVQERTHKVGNSIILVQLFFFSYKGLGYQPKTDIKMIQLKYIVSGNYHDVIRVREYKTGSAHLTGCEVTVFQGKEVWDGWTNCYRSGKTLGETSPIESTGLLDYDSDWARFKHGDAIQTYELQGENSRSITDTSPSKKIEQGELCQEGSTVHERTRYSNAQNSSIE